MKTLTILFALISLNGIAQNDEQEVKQVISNAYIDGIHNNGPAENIRKGFHPSFIMFRLIENDVKPLPIEEWIKNMEANRAKNTQPSTSKAEGKFISVTVAGTSSSVVLELFRDGKKIFTDHLLLYKFKEGWRIVGKTFYRYP